MKEVLVLAVWAWYAAAAPEPLSVTLNPRRATHVLDDHFISLNINPTDLLQGRPFGMGNNSTLSILRGLSPAYVRLGGHDTNRYAFRNTKHIDDVHITSDYIISEEHWREVNEALRNAGLDVIVCLNSALRTAPSEKWDPRNALQLITYSDQQHFNLTWQLGYEPLRTTETTGAQFGKDIAQLRAILNAFPRYLHSSIIGPDVRALHRKEDVDHALEVLMEAGPAINDVTWHPRWPHASAITPSDASDEGYEFPPDYLEWDKNQLHKLLQRALLKKPFWISEPKAENLGSFAEGLIYARRLSLAAKLGIDVVMKQPCLNDISHPKPEFWIALLHKRTLGRTVLDTRPATNHSEVSVVVQCTSHSYDGETDGGLTVFVVNTAGAEQRLVVRGVPQTRIGDAVHQYILTAGSEPTAIFSQMTYLNQEPLLITENGQLPELTPKIKRMGPNLVTKLPPYSIGFWVLPQAKIKMCQQEPQNLVALTVDELNAANVVRTTKKGVNTIRNMTHIIVDKLLGPIIGKEVKETDIDPASFEETPNKRLTRQATRIDMHPLKKRVDEIKHLMDETLQEREHSKERSELKENNLRVAETKINGLATDLKKVINGVDQEKEFGEFLKASGLNQDFGKLMMEDRLARNTRNESEEIETEKSPRAKRQINTTTLKLQEDHNDLAEIERRFRRIIAKHKKSNFNPKKMPSLHLDKINKEFQEDLLLKEITLLENTEEALAEVMKIHQEHHEAAEELLHDELEQMKQEKVATLMEMKKDLGNNHENAFFHLNNLKNSLAKEEDKLPPTKRETSDTIDEEPKKEEPFSAIRSYLNKRKEALQQKQKTPLNILEAKDKQTTTTMPPIETTTEKQLTDSLKMTQDTEKRRTEVLKYMTKYLDQINSVKNDKINKTSSLATSRKPKILLGKGNVPLEGNSNSTDETNQTLSAFINPNENQTFRAPEKVESASIKPEAVEGKSGKNRPIFKRSDIDAVPEKLKFGKYEPSIPNVQAKSIDEISSNGYNGLNVKGKENTESDQQIAPGDNGQASTIHKRKNNTKEPIVKYFISSTKADMPGGEFGEYAVSRTTEELKREKSKDKQPIEEESKGKHFGTAGRKLYVPTSERKDTSREQVPEQLADGSKSEPITKLFFDQKEGQNQITTASGINHGKEDRHDKQQFHEISQIKESAFKQSNGAESKHSISRTIYDETTPERGHKKDKSNSKPLFGKLSERQYKPEAATNTSVGEIPGDKSNSATEKSPPEDSEGHSNPVEFPKFPKEPNHKPLFSETHKKSGEFTTKQSTGGKIFTEESAIKFTGEKSGNKQLADIKPEEKQYSDKPKPIQPVSEGKHSENSSNDQQTDAKGADIAGKSNREQSLPTEDEKLASRKIDSKRKILTHDEISTTGAATEQSITTKDKKQTSGNSPEFPTNKEKLTSGTSATEQQPPANAEKHITAKSTSEQALLHKDAAPTTGNPDSKSLFPAKTELLDSGKSNIEKSIINTAEGNHTVDSAGVQQPDEPKIHTSDDSAKKLPNTSSRHQANIQKILSFREGRKHKLEAAERNAKEKPKTPDGSQNAEGSQQKNDEEPNKTTTTHPHTEARSKRDTYNTQSASLATANGDGYGTDGEKSLSNSILKSPSQPESKVGESTDGSEQVSDLATLVLKEVIPKVYNKTKEAIDSLHLPEYLHNFGKMMENIQNVDKLIKNVADVALPASAISEHIQKVERKKRDVETDTEFVENMLKEKELSYNNETTERPVGENKTTSKNEEEKQQTFFDNIPTEREIIKEGSVPTAIKEEKEIGSYATVEQKEVDEANNRAAKFELKKETTFPTTEKMISETTTEFTTPFTKMENELVRILANETILDKVLENMAEEIVENETMRHEEKILNDNKNKVEREEKKIYSKTPSVIEAERNVVNRKEEKIENATVEIETPKYKLNGVEAETEPTIRKIKKHKHKHHTSTEDPLSPRLEVERNIIEEIIQSLINKQKENKLKEEIPSKMKKNGFKREIGKQEQKGQTLVPREGAAAEILKKLRPGVYVVPSKDMANVHAEQITRAAIATKFGKPMPNVLSLNIYYDKKPENDQTQNNVANNGNILHWSRPPIIPPYKQPTPIYTSGMQPIQPMQPFMTSSPNLPNYYNQPYQMQAPQPMPPYGNFQQPPIRTDPYLINQQPKRYNSDYYYEEPRPPKVPEVIPVSSFSTWSKQQLNNRKDPKDWLLADDDEADKYSSDENNEEDWRVKSEANTENINLSSIEKKKFIEPFWNRTLGEIFKETSHDPFWKLLQQPSIDSEESVEKNEESEKTHENETPTDKDEGEPNEKTRKRRSLNTKPTVVQENSSISEKATAKNRRRRSLNFDSFDIKPFENAWKQPQEKSVQFLLKKLHQPNLNQIKSSLLENNSIVKQILPQNLLDSNKQIHSKESRKVFEKRFNLGGSVESGKEVTNFQLVSPQILVTPNAQQISTPEFIVTASNPMPNPDPTLDPFQQFYDMALELIKAIISSSDSD